MKKIFYLTFFITILFSFEAVSAICCEDPGTSQCKCWSSGYCCYVATGLPCASICDGSCYWSSDPCGGPFDFSISVSPSSGFVYAGQSVYINVTATLVSGTAQNVNFSCSNLPADTTCSFDPTECEPTCDSNLTISTSSSTPVGIHSITVNGTSDGLTRETTYDLTVSTCNLTSATISANCDGDCEKGETISMSGTYTGDCSVANFFQIDAKSADLLCDIQYTGGSMSGIWDSSITVSGGTVSGSWVIPDIPAECSGKTVSAKAAALWDGAPDTGIIINQAETVSGSFTFASGRPPPPTFECDGSKTLVLKIYRGWNLISSPCVYISLVQDTCRAEQGNFYFYNVSTGKWVIDTVGMENLKGGVGYWFYSPKNCLVRISGVGTIASDDITIHPGWNQIGSPTEDMAYAHSIKDHCKTCISGAGGSCSSIKIIRYDPIAQSWKEVEEGEPLENTKGYSAQCID